MIKLIAFDADDTLWHTENIFVETQHKFADILSHYCDIDEIHHQIGQKEKANIAFFGYGIKGFTLSMIETAIELSEGKVSAQDIHEIVLLGKAMLRHPLHTLPHVTETLKKLHGSYKLAIITKGDLLDQNNKINESGLAHFFDYLEVVSEKDTATYEKLFKTWEIAPENMMMIGNSLPSDVLPILELGGYGIHIPYESTAVIEQTTKQGSGPKFKEVSSIKEIPAIVEDINLKYLI